MSTFIAAAVGIAGAAFGARSVMNAYRYAAGRSGMFTNYVRGGFEETLTKREAAQILGIREYASLDAVKKAHRRIMLLNHPDRGGSPFLATKINEAKALLEKEKSSRSR